MLVTGLTLFKGWEEGDNLGKPRILNKHEEKKKKKTSENI